MSKPRHGARVDDIQPLIVRDLESLCVKVEVLDVSRDGVPDLLCGFLGVLTLLECKARLGKLSEAQQRERDAWAAVGVKVATVRSIPEARRAVGVDPDSMEQRRRVMEGLVQAFNGYPPAGLRPSVRRYT